MNPLAGEGGTRSMFPFFTWASNQHCDGMLPAGLEVGSRPWALKLVILFKAATRLARVGLRPAACRASTNRSAEDHAEAPQLATGSVESTWAIHLSKVA